MVLAEATIFLNGTTLTWSIVVGDDTITTLPTGSSFHLFIQSEQNGNIVFQTNVNPILAPLSSYPLNNFYLQSGYVISVEFIVSEGSVVISDLILSNYITVIAAAPTITAANISLTGSVLTWSLTMSDGSTTNSIPTSSYLFAVTNGPSPNPQYSSLTYYSGIYPTVQQSNTPTTSYTLDPSPQSGYLVTAKFINQVANDNSALNAIIYSNTIEVVAPPGGAVEPPAPAQAPTPAPTINAATISLSGKVLTWSLTMSDGSTTNSIPSGSYFAVANGQAGEAAVFNVPHPTPTTSYTFASHPATSNVINAKFGESSTDFIPATLIVQPPTITAATIFLSGTTLTWSLAMSDESTTTVLPAGSYFAVSNGVSGAIGNYSNIMSVTTNMSSYTLTSAPNGNYEVTAKFSSTSSTLSGGIMSNSITNTTIEIITVQVNTSGLVTWLLNNSNSELISKKLPQHAVLGYTYPTDNGSNADNYTTVPISTVTGQKSSQLPNTLSVGIPYAINLNIGGVIGTANYIPSGEVPGAAPAAPAAEAPKDHVGEPGYHGSGEYQPPNTDIANAGLSIKSLPSNGVQLNWDLTNSSNEPVQLLANTIVQLFYKITSSGDAYKRVDITPTDGQTSFDLPRLTTNILHSFYIKFGSNGSGTSDSPIQTIVKTHTPVNYPSVISSASISLSNLTAGDILVNWELKNVNNELVSLTKKSKLALTYTDKQISSNLANRIIREEISPIRSNDDSDDEDDEDTNIITNHVIKNLTLGSTYLVSMDFDNVRSSSKSILSKTVPSKLDFNVIARDKSFALQLVNPLKNSAFDGWDEISKLEVFIGDSRSLISVIINKADLKVDEDFYSTSVGLPDAIELVNGDPHEIALRAGNLLGFGELSSTKLGTPLDTANKIQNTLALPEHSFKLIKGIARDSLSGHNYVFWKRPDDFVLLNKKNADGVNVGPNRITSYKITRQRMMPIGVLTSATGTGLGAPGPINNVEKSWVKSTNNKGFNDANAWLDGGYTNPNDPKIGANGTLEHPLQSSTRVANQTVSAHGELNSATTQNKGIPLFPSHIIKNDTTKDYANNGVWDGATFVVDDKVASVTFTINVGDRDSLDPHLKSNVLNNITYDYEWVDTNVTVGELYRYIVVGVNANGLGEDSQPTNTVLALTTPTASSFSRVFGDKQVTLSLENLGNNGGGVLPISNWFSYIKKEGTNAESAKKYFDVDLSPFNLDGTLNTNYKKALFSVTNNGELLSLKIRKQVLDYASLPWVKALGGDIIESPLLELLGLAYKSPSPPINTRAYLLDQNNELLTKDGEPAVSIEFTPFKNGDNLGGLDKQSGFDPRIHLRYAAFKNSQRIPSMEPIYSFAFNAITDSTVFKFLVSSPLNTNPSYYVRTEIFLIELAIWVTSVDSSPPRNAAAITYVDAPNDITLTRVNGSDKVKVAFTPATTVGGRVFGSMPADVYYNILTINLHTNLITHETHHSLTIPWQSTKITTEVQSLVEGKAYQIVVIPFVKYTDTTLDGKEKWSDYMIRKYYSSRAYVAAAPASKPINVLVKPLDKSFLMNWDASTQTNGGVLDTYLIFAARNISGGIDPETVPTFPADQTAVASVKTPEQFVITTAYETIKAGILGLPAGIKSIVNDLANYNFAVAMRTSVGGFNVPFNAFFSAPPNGNTLNIGFNDYIDKTLIDGTKSDALVDNVAYEALTKPQNVSSISDATSITLVFEKDNNADELLIFSNGELVFDTTLYSRINAIDIDPDTAGKQIRINGVAYTLTQDSGLFGLQQPTLAAAVKDFFWVENKPTFVAYNIKISVQGGGSQNIEIRYGRRVGTIVAYSESATTTASAATPPTNPSNAKFTVDSNVLDIFYDAPIDKGGADTVAFTGATKNSSLYYRAKLFTKTGYESQTPIPLEVAELITARTYKFSNLSNYNANNASDTSYVVTIQAYYLQQNDPKKPSESAIVVVNILEDSVIVPIRVDSKPIVPILTYENDTEAGNKVSVKYPFQSSSSYPIKSVKFYIDGLLINSKTYTAANLVAANSAVGTILTTVFTSSDVAGLLNGKDTIITVVTEGFYNYAQSPSNTTITVRPRRSIVPNDITIVPIGGDGRSFSVSIATGGTAVLGYVAIGKSATGALQVVNQTPISHILGGIATSKDAANLTMTFSVVFASPVVEVLLLNHSEDRIISRPYPVNSGAVWGLA